MLAFSLHSIIRTIKSKKKGTSFLKDFQKIDFFSQFLCKRFSANNTEDRFIRTFYDDKVVTNKVKLRRESLFKKWNWLLRIMGYYSFEASTTRSGQALFRGCEYQAMLVCFDKGFGLGFDWLDSKSFMLHQQLLMMHIWMVHRRLLLSGKKGKKSSRTYVLMNCGKIQNGVLEELE